MKTAYKKPIVMSLLIIAYSMGVLAQTFYYYKGGKIPLKVNDKVSVSIPKNKSDITNVVLRNAKDIDKVSDTEFEILVLKQSDFDEMSALSSWKENEKSVAVSPCYITADGIELFSTPYVNVRLKKEQDIDLLSSEAEKLGLKIVKQDALLPLWYILCVKTGNDKNALECANALWESGKFAAAVPDLSTDNELCSDDPMFDLQWGLQNFDYPGIDISGPSAWEYATGKNIKIAILDTGVDLNHIDLAPNISDLSYDTETNTSPSVVYGDHGTHCAGIAAAVKDNGIQIAGVAPDATIVSISNTLSSATNSRLKRADGIVWAYQHGVDIISNSWSSTEHHESIDEAIHNAFIYGRQGKGCVILFASGNDTTNLNIVKYPANCNDTILAVGAIGKDGLRADYSRYGMALDLVAPGDSILSIVPNDQTMYKNGTSMACPYVAGVAALVLERNSELTVTEVNSIIQSTAKKIPDVNFNVPKPDGLWNEEYGYGLVNAYNAVVNTPSTVYIQDEAITGNRIVSAEKIYVGRDVTDDKPHGNVTLGQGQITLQAKSVVIKNSAKIPLGTTLKIVNR